MVKHNNQLVKNHFRKDWEGNKFPKTWFNQPARKERRRRRRAHKAKLNYPRPVAGQLRPLVHSQTLKYNSKTRLGRGFTLQELKQAGINPHQAKGIGIAVDFRRVDRSADTLNANVQRLKLYKSKLLIFPRKAAKPKKGDSKAEELAKVQQHTGVFPYKVVVRKEKARLVTPKEKTDSAYLTIRKVTGKINKVGDAIRKKRAAEAGTSGGGGGKKPEKEEGGDQKGRKKRTFRKFSYRGTDLDKLLDMTNDQLVELFPARARRRFNRGLKRKSIALVKKLRKAKRAAPFGEKPAVVKTHLRNMIVVPEMIGSMVGVYNGAQFTAVEVKAEMIGHYLGEFSITYKPVKHGKPGIGATHSSRFIPLK